MSDSPSEDTAKRPRHRSWDHWKGEFYSKAKDAIRPSPSDVFIYLKLRERRSSEVHLQPAITPASSIHPIRPTSVIQKYKRPHINLVVLLICLFSTFSLRTPHLLEQCLQPKTHMNLVDFQRITSKSSIEPLSQRETRPCCELLIQVWNSRPSKWL